MNADRGRDQSIEPLLRRSLRAESGAPVTDACLDGETLAAWVDGGLDQQAVAMAEVHVAGCARCQALVGVMARSAPAPAVLVPWWRGSWSVRWLVPFAAGAAAVALWVMVPGPPIVAPQETERAASTPRLADDSRLAAPAPASPLAKETPPSTRADEFRAAPAAAAPAPAARAPSGPPPPAPVPAEAPATAPFAPEVPPAQPRPTFRASQDAPPRAAEEGAASEKRAAAGTELDSARPLLGGNRRAENTADAAAKKRVAEPTLSAQPAPASAPPAPRSLQESVTVTSVEVPALCGPAWRAAPTGVAVELTAGSSPSASVCWVIGRAGTVLLSTNGRTWQRVPFPEAVDLKTVQATDARTATVTTIDGRTLRTADGGKTWMPL